MTLIWSASASLSTSSAVHGSGRLLGFSFVERMGDVGSAVAACNKSSPVFDELLCYLDTIF